MQERQSPPLGERSLLQYDKRTAHVNVIVDDTNILGCTRPILFVHAVIVRYRSSVMIAR